MRYLPHTSEDISEMLAAVGVSNLDALFSTIPEDCRYQGGLKLPESLTEWELYEHMRVLSGNMGASPDYKVFMGGGSYEHCIPASIPYLLLLRVFYSLHSLSARNEPGNPPGNL